MGNLQVLDAKSNPQNMSSLVDGDGSLTLIRTSEHRKSTFRYAFNFTPVATPTDVVRITGSATMAGRIKRIAMGGLATTAGSMPVTLIRRSTAGTQGSAAFSGVNASRHDVNDAAPTCPVQFVQTANFTTPGTTAGNLGQGRLWLPLSTGVPNQLVWDFATRQDKAIILRGTTDFVWINLNGAAVPSGGTIDVEIELEEDTN